MMQRQLRSTRSARVRTLLSSATALLLLASCAGAPVREPLHDTVERLVAQGRVDAALACVDGVLATAPDRADAWRERARCLVLQRELDSALVALEHALALDERDAWSH